MVTGRRRLRFGEVDFFVYSRDVPGTPLRDDRELLEAHWAYMDAFAGSMIARGPTLTPDREAATGSLHVLGLPRVDAAREFVDREPNNQAGVYAEHSIWRFENLLGRTMWEFEGAAGESRFLVIARPDRDRSDCGGGWPIPTECLPPELRQRLILYGALSAPDDGEPVGAAVALEVPDRDAVVGLLEGARVIRDVDRDVEIHDWEFGGRR